MCNINLFWRKSGLTSEDVSFLKTATFISFDNNKDGEGYFTQNTIHKQLEKIDLNLHIKALEGVPWAVFHERYTTHGANDLVNTQPLIKNKTVLAHNGIVSGLGDKNFSDSYEFLGQIVGKNAKTVEEFERAIKEVAEKNKGSKSMVFWNEKFGLYYYKNNSSRFYLLKGEDWFFASTIDFNCQLARNFFGEEKDSAVVECDVLFKINEKTGEWLKVADVVEPVEVVSYTVSKKSGRSLYEYGMGGDSDDDESLMSYQSVENVIDYWVERNLYEIGGRNVKIKRSRNLVIVEGDGYLDEYETLKSSIVRKHLKGDGAVVYVLDLKMFEELEGLV